MRIYLSTALAVTAATAAVVSTSAASSAASSAAASATQGHGGRVAVASTVPVSGPGPLRALAAGSRVRLSVFVGRDQAGLAAAATAISDPASPSYEHYLSPAQVQARFGATAAQQRAVRGWLSRSGLAVTHDDAFVITAMGTAARAEAALRTGLALSDPAGSVEQVVPSGAMTVPAAVAGAIDTVRVSTATVPLSPQQPLPVTASMVAGSKAAAAYTVRCSAYYGQKKATGLPHAYGRAITWAPCGYQPTQLRDAYGATKAGLTGTGASVAVISETTDPTALSDANRWARQRHFPQFARGQFSQYVEPDPGGGGLEEDALDIEAVHGMAPGAKVVYVVGGTKITGDSLLDALNTVVLHRLADVVTSSWNEYFASSVPASVVTSWEGVLKRAAVEGITVNNASGDFGNLLGLQYPSADPWLTSVGGTSLAIGATGNYLWETGWDTDQTTLAANGRSWSPAPPGSFAGASTGGVSDFAEPRYQYGVVSGNLRGGKRMRAVPDVSALADDHLGYQVGLTVPVGTTTKTEFEDVVLGGTSLASPLFAGFEADLIQGRGGKRLGFANPLLYHYAKSATFHDITSNPQGRGFTEAVINGPARNEPLALSTMGQCGIHKTLPCGPGYDMVTGLGSPGPAFFRSFGSRPR